MERVSSVEILLGSSAVVQMASPMAGGHISASLLCLNVPASTINPMCVNYLHRVIVNGLVEFFERLHFDIHHQNLSSHTAIRIFNILVRFLKGQYDMLSNAQQQEATLAAMNSQFPSSLSAIAANAINQKKQMFSTIQHPKYFNYYASIRKDVFEFFLRLRSDKFGKLLLVNKQNPRRILKSKHLHLVMYGIFV